MHTTITTLLSLLTALLLASPGWAESSYFFFMEEDGVVSFTDDPEKIPARYREAFKESTFEEMRTRTDERRTSPAGDVKPSDLNTSRLERLRAEREEDLQKEGERREEERGTGSYPFTDTELIELPNGTRRTAEVTRDSETGEILAIDTPVERAHPEGSPCVFSPSSEDSR